MIIYMAAEKSNNSARLENPTSAASSAVKHGRSLLSWTDLLTVKEIDWSYGELSIRIRPSHQKPLGDTGILSTRPHVEQCVDAEENGQLFSDHVPKYMAFILQGVIKLSDLVCPCMKQQYLKEV